MLGIVLAVLKTLHLLMDMVSCQSLVQSLMRLNAVCNIIVLHRVEFDQLI